MFRKEVVPNNLFSIFIIAEKLRKKIFFLDILLSVKDVKIFVQDEPVFNGP